MGDNSELYPNGWALWRCDIDEGERSVTLVARSAAEALGALEGEEYLEGNAGLDEEEGGALYCDWWYVGIKRIPPEKILNVIFCENPELREDDPLSPYLEWDDDPDFPQYGAKAPACVWAAHFYAFSQRYGRKMMPDVVSDSEAYC